MQPTVHSRCLVNFHTGCILKKLEKIFFNIRVSFTWIKSLIRIQNSWVKGRISSKNAPAIIERGLLYQKAPLIWTYTVQTVQSFIAHTNRLQLTKYKYMHSNVAYYAIKIIFLSPWYFSKKCILQIKSNRENLKERR